MATMYPDRKRREFGKSEAEWHFYRACREQLPGHVVVFHRGRYLLRDPEYWDDDGELDFLVVDPNRGFLVVEVKGGWIRLEGDRWYSTDRHGREHRIDDPFRQATARKHGLIRRLQKAGVRTNRLRFCHAVCFPDCEASEDITAYATRDALIDARDMLDLPGAIERCFGGPKVRGFVPPEVIDRVRELFFPSREVPRARLGVLVERGKRELARLTDEQMWVMQALSWNHRVLVTGCAGSGKTFLALEQARRLARAGYSVLVTCYNRSLASWMRRYLRNNAGLTRAEARRIVARNYHDLALWYAEQARIPVWHQRSRREYFGRLPRVEGSGNWTAYYERYFPQLFARALELSEVRFDALIVDEGHDIPLRWWRLLVGTLKDHQRSPLYVFAEQNQVVLKSTFQRLGEWFERTLEGWVVFGDSDTQHRVENEPFIEGIVPPWLGPVTVLRLTANMRNSRPIAELATRYYLSAWPVLARGADGPPPEFVPVEEGHSPDEVIDEVVARLVHEEGVRPEDITVLVPHFSSRPQPLSVQVIGKYSGVFYRRASPDFTSKAGYVRIGTIPSFRGLESPVVILAAMERTQNYMNRTPTELTYLALTRATQHLIVIGQLPKREVEIVYDLLRLLDERLQDTTGLPAEFPARATRLAEEAQALLERESDISIVIHRLRTGRPLLDLKGIHEPPHDLLGRDLTTLEAEYEHTRQRLEQVAEEIWELLSSQPIGVVANGLP